MRPDTITYVGHATTLIDVASTRLLTDPVLRGRVAHLRRIAPPAPPAADLQADAVLVSHAHHDHLDLASLRMLPPGTVVIAPPACARLLRMRTRHTVRAARVGDRIAVGAVEVLVVHAEHDGRRLGVGPRGGAVGYVVQGSSRVYFAGDTDLFDDMHAVGADLDVALLPVWGWGRRVDAGHMTPEQAARAAALLRPRMAIPIHWGTLASPRVHWLGNPAEPAERFARATAELAPDVRVEVVAPGGQVAIPASTSAM